MNINYDKLPDWWRNAPVNSWKYLCKKNLHVPVREERPDGHIEYSCQNCGIAMTEKQWIDFFREAKNDPPTYHD